jgi:hypothetical protein
MSGGCAIRTATTNDMRRTSRLCKHTSARDAPTCNHSPAHTRPLSRHPCWALTPRPAVAPGTHACTANSAHSSTHRASLATPHQRQIPRVAIRGHSRPGKERARDVVRRVDTTSCSHPKARTQQQAGPRGTRQAAAPQCGHTGAEFALPRTQLHGTHTHTTAGHTHTQTRKARPWHTERHPMMVASKHAKQNVSTAERVEAGWRKRESVEPQVLQSACEHTATRGCKQRGTASQCTPTAAWHSSVPVKPNEKKSGRCRHRARAQCWRTGPAVRACTWMRRQLEPHYRVRLHPAFTIRSTYTGL